MHNGQRSITIAHIEPSSRELKSRRHLQDNQEISLKKTFGCISIVEFVFFFICVAVCYIGSSDLEKYS